MIKIQRAIISVTDKTGVVEFAGSLAELGVEILSTGGTAKKLEAKGVPVIPISSYTGFPEMLDGRVKTLHPKIHGGILGMRGNDTHLSEMKKHGIPPIDMVVVNLYAFEKTVEKDCTLEEAIENIDIGGPTMLRAAAKNYKGVACVTDPDDYFDIIAEMKEYEGKLSEKTRFALAKKVFQATARYDGAISNYLGGLDKDGKNGGDGFPETYSMQVRKTQSLRYGENPHQSAAFYSSSIKFEDVNGLLTGAKCHQGKELSYNNILDVHAALELVREFEEPTATLIKHSNPCGTATSKKGLLEAYNLALECDPKSAFGAVVALNGKVTAELAAKLTDIFLEVIVAPSFDKKALEAFKKKKNLRVIETGKAPQTPKAGAGGIMEIRRASGGYLLQTADLETFSEMKTVTDRKPTKKEMDDLLFAWKVCKHVKSNAIVFASKGRTVGVGVGQMSRIDSTEIAVKKAADVKLKVKGSVLASDAFFPFRDNVDLAAGHGVTAIIQPGGSIKDRQVIDAANEHGIAMVFTGMRHFRH